ncbi:MAG: DUF2786 domain-containing protein [Knoellia sp.]
MSQHSRAWREPGHGDEDSPRSTEALVALALAALDSRRVRAFDDATVALAQRCSISDDGQRSVVTTLVAQVAAGTTQAWQRGWQPTDVHRMAARTLSAPEQALVVDAMSEELGRYAASTVDHRWLAQIEELEGGVWWPRSQTWLDAHRERGVDWLSLLAQTLTVLHLLWTLPHIEKLSPLPGTVPPPEPGTARGQKAVPGKPVGSVDDRILARVRMMLAKAESTTFEAEAETFTAGAQALMARHSIDAAWLAAEERRSGGTGARAHGGPAGRRIGIDTPYDGPKASLLDAVARANRCKMVWTRELGFGTVMGFESDLDGVELLFTSLLVQANTRLMAEGKRADHRGRSRTRSFRQSFLTAYAHRIGERLREVADAEVASAQASAGLRGQELVPILAARDEEVDAVMGEWFPVVKKSSIGSVRDAEGWNVGRSAADEASLDGAVPRRGVGRERA